MKRALGLLAVLAAGCSCDETPDDPSSSSSSAGGTGGFGATASQSSSSNGSNGQGGGGAPGDGPCPGWEGWAKWDDWGPGEPFCYAVDPSATVAPILWEPCHLLSGFSSGCLQMAIDWPNESIAMGLSASVLVEASGATVLSFTRVNTSPEQPNFVMPVVAEADGAVRFALLDAEATPGDYVWGLSTMLKGLGEGRALFRAVSADEQSPEAMVGFGASSTRPFVEHGYSEPGGRGFGASTDIWGTWDSGRIEIARWGEEPKEVWGAAQSSYQLTRFVPFEDFATWHEGDATHANIIAWTPERGGYPFISFGDDDTNGAEALGTDGVDLVWIQSTGRLPDGKYAQRDIMTAPFTTDPALLDPRRLRSYPSSATAILALAAGCGYGAYAYEPGKVLVVRLADGYWWELPSSGCTGPDFTGDFCFEDVYAITCDEMFLRGGTPMNIARVELSALGDPSPPD